MTLTISPLSYDLRASCAKDQGQLSVVSEDRVEKTDGQMEAIYINCRINAVGNQLP